MRQLSTVPAVICLMGPTAIGKSDVALRLARELPVEIISVDSAMIYKGMDIGTAKPDRQHLLDTPHHLIDILEPNQSYSAGAFCHDAMLLIEQIQARQKIPLLVGGTMLYFKALQQGIAEMPIIPVTVRDALRAELQAVGLPVLYQELSRVDPAWARCVHSNDQQRILRGLEVYRTTGQLLSLFQKGSKKQEVIDPVNLVIWPRDRVQLQKRINQRFDSMLTMGFVKEVESLRERYELDSDVNSMRAVGYRQVWQYLDGEIQLSQLAEQGSAATRQLAKRQLTWLRSWPVSIGLVDDDPQLLSKLISIIHSNLGKKYD